MTQAMDNLLALSFFVYIDVPWCSHHHTSVSCTTLSLLAAGRDFVRAFCDLEDLGVHRRECRSDWLRFLVTSCCWSCLIFRSFSCKSFHNSFTITSLSKYRHKTRELTSLEHTNMKTCTGSVADVYKYMNVTNWRWQILNIKIPILGTYEHLSFSWLVTHTSQHKQPYRDSHKLTLSHTNL